MAVTEELPEVEVAIFVDGVALREYEDTDIEEEDRTVTRYVEATSGKSFQIHLKVETSCKFFGDCLAFAIYIDGKKVGSPIVMEKKCEKDAHTRVTKGMQVSADRNRSFVFTSLETVSDGFTLNDEANLVKELGIIRVMANHEHVNGRSINASKNLDVSAVGFVSEKAIKGQSPGPFAVYKFHYRSLEALKSLLIIPRTPSPPPLEERDITTLTHDELCELQRRARAARDEKETKVKIKRERADINPRPRKVARPNANSTQLEVDDNGRVRESSTPTIAEQEVIQLD
ncbi:hypothetical protein LTR36_005118 [Oleoguttula mirabilis]|uniref:DUF7918 domain-containing protein n=1 Tax=Oleoguttula mirabilis TaxID=1507867 RepID=A0AAV9JWB3_9PEZI|nr:hypothetical protein LTR36_005118 [Oleoguttula mirabilis]